VQPSRAPRPATHRRPSPRSGERSAAQTYLHDATGSVVEVGTTRTGDATAVGAGRRRVRTGDEFPFTLSDAKLQPPVLRPGMVTRATLLDRMVRPEAPSLISVVAPAGYGKTTLLAQWAAAKQPRVAWVSADRGDNDPAVLLAYLVAAVDRVEDVDRSLLRAIASPGDARTVVPLLMSTLASMTAPMVIGLDHAEAITSRGSLDLIVELAMSLPPGSQLAIASRDTPPIPSARLRSQGRVLEIGVEDLAMGSADACSLLEEAGVVLSARELDALVERTEGWAAGLYLAALAMNAGSPRTEAGFSFTGDDRFMGDYLRSELLDRVSRAEVTFLTRTSILDRMCGPLCDAVLDAKGSGDQLEELDSRNLLVVPLDRRRVWYRYHQLFRELLLAELSRREPDMISTLHRRAAAWCVQNGRPETAIEYAQAAGDAGLVSQLVLDSMHSVWASGRVDTVLSWMEWLESTPWAEPQFVAIAAHGALILAQLGRPGAVERWAAAAEQTAAIGIRHNGDAPDSVISFMRAALCQHGVAHMRRDARAALDGLTPASPHRWAMLHTEGLAHLLEGDPVKADSLFAHAANVAASSGTPPAVALTLAERGIAAIDRGDRPAAETFSDEALAIVGQGQFDNYWTSALVFAFGARIAAHRGDVATTVELAAKAARLRPLLTYALPVVSVQALLDLGRAYVAIDDQGGARTVLRQAQEIFEQRPDLGVLPQQATELGARLGSRDALGGGASTLTSAELRLLPFLSTHLTLNEIGERLYVSRNTVKTQAASIYRKIGVSSRRQVVKAMHEQGLTPQH
jgi:LuxR family transcriptional regulator, maltose regulon positive regulatory protein